jgi:hypothetical protein
MSKELKTYAALVLSFLADSSQRVRHAALGTLALFAEAFAGNSKSYANMYDSSSHSIRTSCVFPAPAMFHSVTLAVDQVWRSIACYCDCH